MSKLNKDILYLIFDELHDKNTLFSCLLVNKTWCEMIIRNLWRDPWKFKEDRNGKLLLNTIVTHLSEESKNYLKSQGINIRSRSYNKILFNYITFCKHLNLSVIKMILNKIIENKSKIIIIMNEILKLFINDKTKFTHLYIPEKFDYQLNLIPEAKNCLSEIQFLSCDTSINDKSLIGLMEICDSIKELELFMELENNNYGFTKLIKQQKKLLKIHFFPNSKYPIYYPCDDSYYDAIENSLIKHSSTIEYLKTPRHINTKILSSFVNLKVLDMSNHYMNWEFKWNQNLIFPHLEILKVSRFSIHTVINIIENTSGHLIEISIEKVYWNNETIIQAIYQNCPKLKYLKMMLEHKDLLEFKNILINCQDLNELYIAAGHYFWGDLFEILAEYSPINLYKFTFTIMIIISESLDDFFKLWEGRRPMILKFFSNSKNIKKMMKYYKAKGIIEDYDYKLDYKEDLVWVRMCR
ncbi:hypothetical protein RhiirA5_420176 [Rhizophagus irregularis]|uniref:F-box domain-containing protein n=2 Tax=Rhizophagus irregularis TaxID=588596 RepID=A0A2N0PGP2_9GLOM|nr:hypothetical protein RhiirA5_420176 [Rhizophagus irregularis]PKC56917.1 hypothetical protein RhiirA1_473299 [Rhizophagus irregularis]